MGPIGPTGPVDFAANEVFLGPTAPTGPEAELWYDSATLTTPVSPFPPGGTAEQSLTQTAGGMGWAGPNLKLTGGTVGDVDVTGNVTVGARLTSPTVGGDVWFNNDITAASVEDRTAYDWEEWPAGLNLTADWGQGGSVGPCKVWRNRYAVLMNLDLRRSGSRPFHEWLTVFANPLPVGWRPPVVLWDTFHAVEVNWQGPLMQARLQPDGQLSLWAHGSWAWQVNSKIPIYFCYPRPPG